MGSSATLKNLLSAKPENDDSCFRHLDSTARSLGLQSLPGLHARKQKAFEQELDQTLTETFDNIEPSTSPSTATPGLRDDKFVFSLTERDIFRQRPQQPLTLQKPAPRIRSNVVSHSDSKESVTSTQSDSVYERLVRTGVVDPSGPPREDRNLHSSMSDSDRAGSDVGKLNGKTTSDRKFLQRYLNNLNSTSTANGKSQVPMSMNVSDQNQNVNMNVVENGVAGLKLVEDEEEPQSWQAWDEPRSSHDGKQPLSFKEELNASTSLSEKDEAVDCSPLSCNNNESVNDAAAGPVAASRSKVPLIPARTKFIEPGLEEDLECPNQDRPIDFSQRYRSESEPEPPAKAGRKNSKKETAVVYGDYAETDLDQPTDYSLQYGEEDDDLADFEGQEIAASIHEDSLKMYCTEGTPYETPYNFSTATSLSDLRIEPPLKEENDEDLKRENDAPNVSQPESTSAVVKSSESPPQDDSKVAESGSLSPTEKPVQFCDEGTPGACMSRFDSLSSLDKNEEVGDEVDGKATSSPVKLDEKCEPSVVSKTPPGSPPVSNEPQNQPVDQEGMHTV